MGARTRDDPEVVRIRIRDEVRVAGESDGVRFFGMNFRERGPELEYGNPDSFRKNAA